MTPTLANTILAVAAEVSSADVWIHTCCTAADEAVSAVTPEPSLTDEHRADLKAMLGRDSSLTPTLEWLRDELERANTEVGAVTLHFPPSCSLPTVLHHLSALGCLSPREKSAVSAALGHRRRAGADAQDAAATAFTSNLPPLTNRTNIRAYIACVTVGLGRRYYNGHAASALLYAAQVALSAHAKRKQGAGKPQK